MAGGLPDVPEVEGVVALLRRGQQLRARGLEDRGGALDQRRGELPHRGLKAKAEEVREDGAEDPGHGFGRRLGRYHLVSARAAAWDDEAGTHTCTHVCTDDNIGRTTTSDDGHR